MKAGAGKRRYVLCGRCGRDISARVGGGPVAHKCPHGRTCIAPAWERFDPSCTECAKTFPQAHTVRGTLAGGLKGGAA